LTNKNSHKGLTHSTSVRGQYAASRNLMRTTPPPGALRFVGPLTRGIPRVFCHRRGVIVYGRLHSLPFHYLPPTFPPSVSPSLPPPCPFQGESPTVLDAMAEGANRRAGTLRRPLVRWPSVHPIPHKGPSPPFPETVKRGQALQRTQCISSRPRESKSTRVSLAPGRRDPRLF